MTVFLTSDACVFDIRCLGHFHIQIEKDIIYAEYQLAETVFKHSNSSLSQVLKSANEV